MQFTFSPTLAGFGLQKYSTLCGDTMVRFRELCGGRRLIGNEFAGVRLEKGGMPLLLMPFSPPLIHIHLNVSGDYPQQLVYQLSHELCHLWTEAIRNYSPLGYNQTFTWLEECICEACSQLVIESFIHNPLATGGSKTDWRTSESWREYLAQSEKLSDNLPLLISTNLQSLIRAPITTTRDIQFCVATAIKRVGGIWAAARAINSFPRDPLWSLPKYLSEWRKSSSCLPKDSSIAILAIDQIEAILC